MKEEMGVVWVSCQSVDDTQCLSFFEVLSIKPNETQHHIGAYGLVAARLSSLVLPLWPSGCIEWMKLDCKYCESNVVCGEEDYIHGLVATLVVEDCLLRSIGGIL